MKRKLLIAIVLVVVIAGALAAVRVLQIGKLVAAGKAFVPPPEFVSSATARSENWQNTLDAIGSISAVQGVNVAPEIAGTVSEIAFESGAVVDKGALLARLNTSSEQAQLRALAAQAELARINAERVGILRTNNTVSQSEWDTAEATWKQDQANADAIRAAIEKKTIRAPFAGKLGIRLVNVGEYLDTGKAIVSLQSLSPVYAEFSLPQQDLAQLKTGMSVRVTLDSYPGRQFDGVLTAMNPELDPATRSIRLQATLDNPEQLLRPGMFARMQLLLPSEQSVLVVPATAILSAPFGDSVFVIESKGSTNSPATQVVRQQFVRVGRSRGDFVSIESGLKPGEQVVSSGIFKLRNGMTIAENNQVAPDASETPQPPDR
jgi:membrane fusion protein (multidrug efflux system)